jgi:hypothetical protein
MVDLVIVIVSAIVVTAAFTVVAVVFRRWWWFRRSISSWRSSLSSLSLWQSSMQPSPLSSFRLRGGRGVTAMVAVVIATSSFVVALVGVRSRDRSRIHALRMSNDKFQSVANGCHRQYTMSSCEGHADLSMCPKAVRITVPCPSRYHKGFSSKCQCEDVVPITMAGTGRKHARRNERESGTVHAVPQCLEMDRRTLA